jgi:DNA recombination protein RmuC
MQNAPYFAAAATLGLFALLLWLAARSIRLERELARSRERSEDLTRDQERVLARQLAATREEMINQVARGQRAAEKAILLTGNRLFQGMEQRFGDLKEHFAEDAGDLRAALVERFERLQQSTADSLADGRLAQQEALATGMTAVARQVHEALGRHGEALVHQVQALAETTDERLKQISGQVERRLAEGFEKTTETFGQVLQHLTRIDEAQKRLAELSSNVVTLQEILADKRSRGAFGEVQLNALVRNIMPEGSFVLQHSLGNGTRVDCLLKLPDPTGSVAVDAKFPLESYQRMTDVNLSQPEREKSARRFRLDIRKHIGDIADKYILRGETAEGAMMFIPAEAVFAEIHAHHPELVQEAQRRQVWLASPTTMMAVLTTARAVLKDAATQEQVHVIRKHLYALSRDFGLFQNRMDKLATHIAQAQRDVDDVHRSARRISGRFRKIEEVELDEPGKPLVGLAGGAGAEAEGGV